MHERRPNSAWVALLSALPPPDTTILILGVCRHLVHPLRPFSQESSIPRTSSCCLRLRFFQLRSSLQPKLEPLSIHVTPSTLLLLSVFVTNLSLSIAATRKTSDRRRPRGLHFPPEHDCPVIVQDKVGGLFADWKQAGIGIELSDTTRCGHPPRALSAPPPLGTNPRFGFLSARCSCCHWHTSSGLGAQRQTRLFGSSETEPTPPLTVTHDHD